MRPHDHSEAEQDEDWPSCAVPTVEQTDALTDALLQAADTWWSRTHPDRPAASPMERLVGWLDLLIEQGDPEPEPETDTQPDRQTDSQTDELTDGLTDAAHAPHSPTPSPT